jgi:hypothetical protein
MNKPRLGDVDGALLAVGGVEGGDVDVTGHRSAQQPCN